MNPIRPDNPFWFSRTDRYVLQDRVLSPCDKAVYGVLCTHEDVRTRSCVLKIKTIATETNCSERSVQLSLKALVERGVIERTERFENGRQKASSYRLIGCNAPCYMDAQSAPMVEICTDGGVKSATPFLRETVINESKDSSPSERALRTPEPSSQTDDPVDLREVPAIMREVVEYFLLKVGRTRLHVEELSAIRALERAHTPHRIIREIAKAAERYGRNKKPLAELSLLYIHEALKHQVSKRGDQETITQGKTAPDPYKGAYL